MINQLNDIINFLISIEPDRDKLSHLFYGSIISLILFVITKKPQIIILLIIAVTKEMFDLFNKNSIFELLDIFYSVIPSIIIYMIIKYKEKWKKTF